MNKEEKAIKKEEDKHGRRSFFKHISKYLLGFGTFTIASLFGLKRSGELRFGKMKGSEFGLSEAYGMCSASVDCAGGGGQCSASVDCAGGGGQCSASVDCAGS